MARNTRYSPELRERAVTMVVEHRSEYPSEWATMTAVAGMLGMT
ncbi:MAG: IS3 family transposase, partial [Actinomycetes bacterium]